MLEMDDLSPFARDMARAASALCVSEPASREDAGKFRDAVRDFVERFVADRTRLAPERAKFRMIGATMHHVSALAVFRLSPRPAIERLPGEIRALDGGTFFGDAEEMEEFARRLCERELDDPKNMDALAGFAEKWDGGGGISFRKSGESGFRNCACASCGGSGRARCDSCGGDGRAACLACGGSGVDGCPSCGGSGEVACPSCDGQGQVRCDYCGGRGDIPTGGLTGDLRYAACHECGGSGWLHCRDCMSTGRRRCADCGGTGEIACGGCDGSGSVPCGVCGGSGSVDCGDCDGLGRVHEIIRADVFFDVDRIEFAGNVPDLDGVRFHRRDLVRCDGTREVVAVLSHFVMECRFALGPKGREMGALVIPEPGGGLSIRILGSMADALVDLTDTGVKDAARDLEKALRLPLAERIPAFLDACGILDIPFFADRWRGELERPDSDREMAGFRRLALDGYAGMIRRMAIPFAIAAFALPFAFPLFHGFLAEAVSGHALKAALALASAGGAILFTILKNARVGRLFRETDRRIPVRLSRSNRAKWARQEGSLMILLGAALGCAGAWLLLP